MDFALSVVVNISIRSPNGLSGSNSSGGTGKEHSLTDDDTPKIAPIPVEDIPLIVERYSHHFRRVLPEDEYEDEASVTIDRRSDSNRKRHR